MKTEFQLMWEEHYRAEKEWLYTNEHLTEKELRLFDANIDDINNNIEPILIELQKASDVFKKYSYEEIMYDGLNISFGGYAVGIENKHKAMIKRFNKYSCFILNFDLGGEFHCEYQYKNAGAYYSLSVGYNRPQELRFHSDSDE